MTDRHNSPVHIPAFEDEACTVDLRKQLLRKNPLFQDLTEHAIDRVNSRFRSVSFERGESIIREGKTAERFYILATGVAKLFRTHHDGRTILLDILSSGDYFGSIADAGFGPREYEETVIADSNVCGISIGSDAFRGILEEQPSVALRTVDTLSSRLRLANEMVQQLGGSSVETRVAYVLLRLAKKLGQPWEDKILIRAPLSREEIAAMAGTSTESCSRTLSDFRRRNLVSAGRGWVALVDTESLEDLISK